MLPVHTPAPQDLDEAFHTWAGYIRRGNTALFEPIPTGFIDIDNVLGGGLYAEDLYLLAGKQGVGKTTQMLQMAQHQGRNQHLAIVLCFEHTEITMLERYICQASGEVDPGNPVGMADLREIYKSIVTYYQHSGKSLDEARLIDELVNEIPKGQEIWALLSEAFRYIWLIKGDPVYTNPAAIDAYVEMAKQEGYGNIVLYVDYLQRVPVPPQHGVWLNTEQRIEHVARALKGIAMRHPIPVVAVAAADADGLRGGRIHLENLWGNATMQYEPDAAIILNVDRSDNGVEVVRASIEKNRRGRSEVEYRHHFWGAAYRFSPRGVLVPDDESWQGERLQLRRKA